MKGQIAHCLDNLRKASLSSPLKVWNGVPVKRRAGVLALLYTDHYGDLSCMVTVRSQAISYAGDAALPGGKADTPEEQPYEVARREAWEEVGLPLDNKLPANESIEFLMSMPSYLSSGFLVVVPSVAYLRTEREVVFKNNLPQIFQNNWQSDEVHSIFSVPLNRFLQRGRYRSDAANWNGLKFPQHYFSVLSREKMIGDPGVLTVWGLTANILIDCARIAFGREPDMPHRRPGSFGDQALIEELLKKGELQTPKQEKPVNFRKLFGKDSDILLARSPP